MKESYECEVATHIGPESCGAAREGGVEALTGERAGRVLSRVRKLTPGRRRCRRKRKAPKAEIDYLLSRIARTDKRARLEQPLARASAE
jgi:hypothetical protein